MSPLRVRPVWGTLVGVGMACIALLFLAIPYLIFGYDAFGREGGGVEGTIVLYIASGAAGGCLVGISLPLVRRRLGAVLVGAVGIAPYFTFQSGVFFHPPHGGSGFGLWEVALFSLAVGGTAGYLVRDRLFGELDSMVSADE